jgi:DNA-binding NarL/FixJ family response regulator
MAKTEVSPAVKEKALTLLLVDDHELVRSGLRLLLESSLGHRVLEASSAEAAVTQVRESDPDVVLLDVCMPDHDGLWALAKIRSLRPGVPVLMISTFDDESRIREALDLGAAGFLLKGAGLQQVAESIETARSGCGVYLHPIVAEKLLKVKRSADTEQLTERELDVLTLLVEGATNEEIGSRLFVTEKTVKTHLSAIFRKLAVSNRTQAATKAIREGLIIEAPEATRSA